MITNIPPYILLIAGSLLLPILKPRLRNPYFLLLSGIVIAQVFYLPLGHEVSFSLLDYNLILVHFDRLARIFSYIFAVILAIGGIYAMHNRDAAHQIAALWYGAGALAVVMAGDYYTFFFFWELMAVSSTYLIWARKEEFSHKAGMRYLIAHVFGGGLLFVGILLHVQEQGTIIIALQEYESAGLGAWLMLFGVALNTGLPPLHAWLPDAYPKATISGTIFLGSFTTKSAVYMLCRSFAGWDILIGWGVIMALYGVVYAVLVDDIRELLAYHIISQVGYMVAGAGIGTELAINGAAAHAFSHIPYKSLLLMGVGAALYSTDKSKQSELGGLFPKQRMTVFLYMIGAFSISGFPLFNGFTSKSMVISGAAEAHYSWAMLLLILASVGTFFSTGLKLPYFTWFGENRGAEVKRPVPPHMHIAMGLLAFICIFFGVLPQVMYYWAPFPNTNYEPYNLPHLSETVQILALTFVAFWIARRKLYPKPATVLDFDWFYRRPRDWADRVILGSTINAFSYTERQVELLREKLVLWLNPNPKSSQEVRDSSVDTQSMLSAAVLVFLFGSLLALAFSL